MIAPFGASEPNNATSPPCCCNGSPSGRTTARSTQGASLRQSLAQRFAGHGQAVEMQQRLQFAQHGADAAGGEQILHVMLAGRLQIDQHRRLIGELVEALERHLDAGRPAIAVRWITALVEPPMASSTRSAFSTDLRVMMRLGRKLRADQRDSAARRWPRRRAAGRHGPPGSPPCPAASCRALRRCAAMVLAVPMTAQVPAVVARLPSTSSMSGCAISPAR